MSLRRTADRTQPRKRKRPRARHESVTTSKVGSFIACAGRLRKGLSVHGFGGKAGTTWTTCGQRTKVILRRAEVVAKSKTLTRAWACTCGTHLQAGPDDRSRPLAGDLERDRPTSARAPGGPIVCKGEAYASSSLIRLRVRLWSTAIPGPMVVAIVALSR